MYSLAGATTSILALSAFADHTLASRVGRPALCPDACASYDPNDWFAFHSVPQLTRCNETMLLDFNIFNDLEDPDAQSTLRVCTSGDFEKLQNSSTVQTASSTPLVKNSVQYQVGGWGSTSSASVENDYATLLEALETYLIGNPQKAELFGYSNEVIAGVYLGNSIQQAANVESAIEELQKFLSGSDYSTAAIQYCGVNANETIGIAVDLNGDISSIQEYVQAWHKGGCLSNFDTKTTFSASLTFQAGVNKANETLSTYSWVSRGWHGPHMSHSHKHKRATDTCSYVEVVSGDSCASLITECGITDTEFYEYNTASDLCSTLAVGQYICCSSGSLPDFAPSAYANGTCYTYNVQSGDSCSSLAAAYSLTEAEIESYNNETWAWYGCSELQAGQNICLSSGNPPYPEPIANAECGPQVPGTIFNSTDSSDWESYNPCPLNACCDAYGECGISPTYCTRIFAADNNPGTAGNGTNGCLSNCGTTITNWAVSPSSFSKVGYWEPSSLERPCLQMDADSIDTSQYTHVMFAFGNITTDFSINVYGYEDQLSEFLALDNVKRMMSFGGWDFSTGVDTYMIFREGTSAIYRAALVTNVVNYIVDTGLDGVDFDWEYPGETDIEGIPAGSEDEGDNFLAFLKDIREALPSDKILSITAPASYWYLQNFPIAEMAEVVDFINYMTYDLHGVWDKGNEWAEDGCPAGDCLFSHINMTETEWALAMLTKSGIGTSQIMVGVSSYGRSFEMSEAGCYNSSCTWTAAGEAGKCTETAGYISNAEINQILLTNTNSNLYSDGNVTNFIVYNDTQWVGYMTNETKGKRAVYYEGWNFAGTADWAIDLAEFVDNELAAAAASESSGAQATITIDPEVWGESSPAVTCAPPCLMVMPPLPLTTNTTISFDPWSTHITYSSVGTSTTALRGGSTTTFNYFSTVLVPYVINLGPIRTDYINVWNQQITGGQTNVVQTSSIVPTPTPITWTPTVGGNTTIIGGTTSVMPGFTYSSGNVTYSTTAWTGIWGGSTYVTGGTTLPPQTSTVTPFAYPTTSDTTPDPTLNTVKTTVKSVSNSKSWGPTPTSSHEHTGSICVENCNGGCKLCPPGLNIDIDISGGGGGGGGGGGDDDDDDDNNDRKTTTITESAYTTTMTEDGKLTTITESARTTTETETESSSSTETSITLTAGIAIGTYTAFVESSGSLEATTEPIDSLLSIATILNREFSSLYSAEISSLQAGLYTTTTSTTSTSTTSTTKTSTSTTSTTAAAATPTEELYISLSEDANLLEDQYTWMYFVEKYDASFTVCDGYDTGVTASEDATYPGTISFSNDINGMSDCVYTGTSSGPGTFTCPALGEVVQCLAVETTAKTCYTYLAPIEVTAKILCTW